MEQCAEENLFRLATGKWYIRTFNPCNPCKVHHAVCELFNWASAQDTCTNKHFPYLQHCWTSSVWIFQCSSGALSAFVVPRDLQPWQIPSEIIKPKYSLLNLLTSKWILKNDIEIAAGNMLDISAAINPSKIIMKIKYHLLSHLLIRFGPLLGAATVTFECYNGIFRFCSILSNHLAPSCDIALQLADQEVLRHFLSGECWMSEVHSGKHTEWKQPTPAVSSFLNKHPFLVALLGYGCDTATISLVPGLFFDIIITGYHLISTGIIGNIKVDVLKHSPNGKKTLQVAMEWMNTTHAVHAINIPEVINTNPNMKWYHGKSVVSQVHNEYAIGTWTFAKSPFCIVHLKTITEIKTSDS